MLNELCDLNGISGREHAVRDYIISHLPSDAEYRIDPLGSLIVYKKGKAEPKNKVMLDAHMDEVGFIITYITDDGYLKFTTVGGIDERVIFGRAVKVGKELIPGVIGGKAIHQTTSEERGKLPSVEDMYIDIGASSKKEALSHVSLGDAVYFDSCYREFGDGFIKSKAIDDRLGCAIMLDVLGRIKGQNIPLDLYFCFTVREEIGLSGARTAAQALSPEYSVVLESTAVADLPDVPENSRVSELGKGGAVSRPFDDLRSRICEICPVSRRKEKHSGSDQALCLGRKRRRTYPQVERRSPCARDLGAVKVYPFAGVRDKRGRLLLYGRPALCNNNRI